MRRLQRNARIGVDGVPGPRTRRALGTLGPASLRIRMLVAGMVGWDVSQTQFLLAWHGFPSGPMDGHFGARTTAALRRFQVHAHLVADGVAGPATFAALRRRSSVRDPSLCADRRLLDGRLRAAREPLPHGARLSGRLLRRVRAAASGRVTQVGWDPGRLRHLRRRSALLGDVHAGTRISPASASRGPAGRARPAHRPRRRVGERDRPPPPLRAAHPPGRGRSGPAPL